MTTASGSVDHTTYACTKAKSTTVKMRLFTDTSVAVASDLFEFNTITSRYNTCLVRLLSLL